MRSLLRSMFSISMAVVVVGLAVTTVRSESLLISFLSLSLATFTVSFLSGKAFDAMLGDEAEDIEEEDSEEKLSSKEERI